MLKKLLCFVSVILIFVPTSIYASEVYYTNNYGLPFTKFQYDTMVDILSEETVANMTYEEYEIHNVANKSANNYEYVQYDDVEDSNNRATFHETGCKHISIGKSCDSTSCLVDVTTLWKCIPSVKSYDVTGVRLSNTNFIANAYSLHVKMDGTLRSHDGRLGASNGVGFAFKIVSSGDVEYAIVATEVLPKGYIYGSYQHAIKNISLTTALDFTFNSSGYGSVFLWPSSYGQIFDQMSGVAISLSS